MPNAAIWSQCSSRGLITRKLPEQLEFVNALPRNPTGKILERDLQAQFADESQR